MIQATKGGKSPPKRQNPTSGQTGRALKYESYTTYNTPSTSEMLHQLSSAMLNNLGHAPANLCIDGKLERFDIGKRGNKAGWYVAHQTKWGIVARYGDWRVGCTHQYSSFQNSKLKKSELADLKKIQRAQAKARQDEQDATAAKAQAKAVKMWADSTPASHAHPYLMTKRIQAHGAKQLGDLLLIPIHDLDGYLCNLQIITADGQKRFLKGGRKRGLCCFIGDSLNNTRGVYLCEGFATGASLYAAYQQPVIIAFDAGNLLAVATNYRNHYPHVPLTICADNDRKSSGNTGVTKAQEVAAKVAGVSIIVPTFPDDAPLSLSDFNDLANWLEGAA